MTTYGDRAEDARQLLENWVMATNKTSIALQALWADLPLAEGPVGEALSEAAKARLRCVTAEMVKGVKAMAAIGESGEPLSESAREVMRNSMVELRTLGRALDSVDGNPLHCQP